MDVFENGELDLQKVLRICCSNGMFFGTIELYVMTTDPILTTEVPVQISIAQKDYEMLLTGIFIIGATIYILFMIGYREICCRNKFSVEVSLLEIFYLLLIVVLFMKFHLWKDLYTIAGYAVLFLFVFSGVETVLQTQKLREKMQNLMITRKIKFVPKFGTSQITGGI